MVKTATATQRIVRCCLSSNSAGWRRTVTTIWRSGRPQATGPTVGRPQQSGKSLGTVQPFATLVLTCSKPKVVCLRLQTHAQTHIQRLPDADTHRVNPEGPDATSATCNTVPERCELAAVRRGPHSGGVRRVRSSRCERLRCWPQCRRCGGPQSLVRARTEPGRMRILWYASTKRPSTVCDVLNSPRPPHCRLPGTLRGRTPTARLHDACHPHHSAEQKHTCFMTFINACMSLNTVATNFRICTWRYFVMAGRRACHELSRRRQSCGHNH